MNDQKSTHDAFASQFERISGLNEWMIWFAVLAGGSGVILTAIFKVAPPEITAGNILSPGNIFYVIMAFVTVATTSRSFLDARFLEQETKLASRQVKDLVEMDDLSEFLRTSKRSMFRSHIDSLFLIFQEDYEIQQDNLIELLHDRLLARNRVSELFASILITLGLIGTVVGLIIMVSEMRRTLATFDPNGDANIVADLMQEGGALSGLDTAFLTTLIGAVFGGVMLRVLTNVVEANITKYTAHIAELTEVNVLPSLRRTARALEKSGFYDRQQ